jgi:hypothetical protein
MPGVNTGLFTSGLSSISGAVSDLFQGMYAAPAQQAAAEAQAASAQAAGQADILQGQGAAIEGQSYGQAASLAALNAQYTAQSTAIQEAQASRTLFTTLGTQAATAAGAGSSGGGSAADILRNSSQQGALNAAVLQQQGLITEAGYTEQAASYNLMQSAANVTQQADIVSAQGEEQAASEYQTEAGLIGESATGDYISAALAGITGVAEIGLAPFTGGASVAVGAAVAAA